MINFPFPVEAFTNFLIQAKCHTYASQGDEATVTPLLPGSKQLEFRDDLLLYRDIYVGMSYFVGQEIVYYEDQPVWSMSYAGGVTSMVRNLHEISSIYAFLRVALRQVSVPYPYRGPQSVHEGPYLYTNQSQGALNNFWGQEVITRDDQQVYALHYHGGVLR